MSPRIRWVIAVLIAAAVFAVVVWLDAVVIKNAQPPPPHAFIIRNSGGVWLRAFGSVVVGGASIAYASLAWWSRSLTASVIFFIGGAAGLVVAPSLYMLPGDWPYYLNLMLTWWLDVTSGPLNAAQILCGALVVSGALGLYRWAFTRQLALKDA